MAKSDLAWLCSAPRRWQRYGTFGVAWAMVLGLSACGARMSEQHYFAAVDPSTNRITNVYRLQVSGEVGMANARYVAGYYDERAVDLFFNEVKAADIGTTAAVSGAPRWFDPACSGADAAACRAERERRLAMVPIGGAEGQNHGSFVLILSTNADAIAGTISQFAETNANVNTMLFMATRQRQEEAAIRVAVSPTVDRNRRQTALELKQLITQSDSANDADLYLSMLRATAAATTPGAPPAFATFDEARIWFASQPRQVQP